MNIKITGIGYFLPENIETSEQLSPKVGKSIDWITSRTGVKERRVSDIDVDLMGAKASKLALKNKVPDLILNASGVGKQVIPDTSVFIQKELGFKDVYFENKISYLFGYSSEIDETISEKSILDFHYP